MKGREQKISKDTYQQRDRAELEVYAGGQTYMRITENNFANVDKPSYGLLEQILSPSNLNKSYKRVMSNAGSGGIDEMEVESLKDYLVNNKEALIQSILDGTTLISDSEFHLKCINAFLSSARFFIILIYFLLK
jgi:RNA-directed DNA polymerase